MDSTSLSIFVVWNHVNTALGQAHKQNTWMKLLVVEMLELLELLTIFYEFNTEGVNFDVEADSLGYDREKGDRFTDASNIPRVIREIRALWLHKSNWCELSCAEHKLTLLLVVIKIFNVVLGPSLLGFIPHADLWLLEWSDEDVWR